MAEKVTIGNCELWHGDCREVLPLLPPVDLILTDPPYGLAEKLQGGTWGKKYDGPDYDWDAKAPDLFFVNDGQKAIVWGGNYMSVPPSRCWLAWYKRDSVRTMADFELAWTSFDSNSRIFDWTIAATNAERVGHPTQKPLKLMEWCLGFAPEARTVCDPFMGSGTTGVACARMGLQFVGIERERKYFEIACRRIEQAYAQPRLFEDTKVGAGETAVQGDMLLPANV